MKAYNSDIGVGEFVAGHAKPYDPATDNYFIRFNCARYVCRSVE
jgi:hypothetical protein